MRIEFKILASVLLDVTVKTQNLSTVIREMFCPGNQKTFIQENTRIHNTFFQYNAYQFNLQILKQYSI